MMSFFPLFAALTTIACHPVNSDKILGRDLAAAHSSFANLLPDASFGFTPIPGRERVFTRGDLTKIAAAHGIEGELPENLCFAWPTALPARADLLDGMHKALEQRDVSIELLEQSLEQAPKGQVVFPIVNLPLVSEGPVVWRGYVQYGTDKRFWIWARVRLTVREKRLVVTEAIRPGEPIRPEQIRVSTFEGPLSREGFPNDPAVAVGMIARTTISAGSFIREKLLEAPRDIQRGDRVQVVVQMASARIEADGIAEGSGKKGSLITVRNAKSGRTFLAQIQEKGRVIVNPTAPASLVAGEKGW